VVGQSVLDLGRAVEARAAMAEHLEAAARRLPEPGSRRD
jgi:hypothetical protein